MLFLPPFARGGELLSPQEVVADPVAALETLASGIKALQKEINQDKLQSSRA